MTRYKKVKPIYLSVQAIHQRVGADAVSRALGYSVRAVYQWAESPEESGKISPIQRFREWADFVTKVDDPEVHEAVLELIRPVLDNMGMSVVGESLVRELRRIVDTVSPDDRRMDEVNGSTMIHRCGSPLQQLGPAATYWCATCGGMK